MDSRKLSPAKKSAKDFILDAEVKSKTEEEKIRREGIQFPWNDQRVRQDVQKIKYISEYNNKSQ